MRGAKLILQVRQALLHLNPQEVREAAARPVIIEIGASTPEMYAEIERFLVPDTLTPEKSSEAMRSVVRAGSSTVEPAIRIYEGSMPHREGTILFNPASPQTTVREVLAAKPDLNLALARRFPAFRECVSADLIKSVARDNALFSLATALPSIVPFLSVPFALGEFASDAAFLTMNQVRMAFLLAAASGRTPGYREQKAEIGSIVAGAFGWRSLARELAGKIPMGGGLIPKAAIAYAGTYVAGASLERLYRLGYGYTKSEQEKAYKDAFDKGRAIASQMLEAWRAKKAEATRR